MDQGIAISKLKRTIEYQNIKIKHLSECLSDMKDSLKETGIEVDGYKIRWRDYDYLIIERDDCPHLTRIIAGGDFGSLLSSLTGVQEVKENG